MHFNTAFILVIKSAVIEFVNVNVCIDFTKAMTVPVRTPETRTIAFFPGSSIGNFEPKHAKQFLRQVADMVGAGGGMLIADRQTVFQNSATSGGGIFTASGLQLAIGGSRRLPCIMRAFLDTGARLVHGIIR